MTTLVLATATAYLLNLLHVKSARLHRPPGTARLAAENFQLQLFITAETQKRSCASRWTPQHMFSTVRRISEVQRLERRALEILVPLSAAPALPAMRYRVTDKNHLAATGLDKSTLLLEALAPPMIRIG